MSRIVHIIAILTAFFTAFLFIDSRYAQSGHVKSIQLRLEHKILADRSNDIQQRVWQLEDRYPKDKFPNGMP